MVNASPDSLAAFSVVRTVDDAVARAKMLINQGCVGIDLGGAGSTEHADRVDVEEEWSRLDGKVQAVAGLGVDLSVDTWKPEVMARALDAGATIMNAADGLQDPAMVALAADRGCPVVMPFVSGADPKAMAFVEGDPYDTILPWFDGAIARVTAAGVAESQLILDPGTGFGPAGWAWEERYRYQRQVYSQLDRLRIFGLPVYMALPWKLDGGRRELLDILLQVGFDYGRTHFPDQVLAAAELARHA